MVLRGMRPHRNPQSKKGDAMSFQQQFDNIFSPARPAERQLIGGLMMTSYCAQRDNGMAADKAASLLGVPADLAEQFYQIHKEDKNNG